MSPATFRVHGLEFALRFFVLAGFTSNATK
jgi:hypothetical protein